MREQRFRSWCRLLLILEEDRKVLRASTVLNRFLALALLLALAAAIYHIILNP